MSEERGSRLTGRQIQQIRKYLRGLDGDAESVVARIGRIVAYPPSASGNVRRYRFGVALMLLAIFEILLAVVLPSDDRRWIFVGFSLLTAAVAAWQIDVAKER